MTSHRCLSRLQGSMFSYQIRAAWWLRCRGLIVSGMASHCIFKATAIIADEVESNLSRAQSI